MGKIKLITMSRDFGTDIDDLIRKLSQEIKGEVLDREKLYAELEKLGISREKIERNGELSKEEKEEFIDLYKEGIRKVVGNYLEKGMVFLLGRGGQFLYQGEDFVFHINVIAPLNYRVKYLCEKYPLSQEKALELIKEKDLQREIYYYSFFFSDWKDPYLYHLVIDKSFFSDREIEELIWKVLEKEEVPVPALEQLSFPTKPTFANESEEEFAKILSFYQIKWEYEPRAFPLEWDSEGQVLESFSPDFYLPDFDLYIELTLQKPKLISEKLRKIRKLEELYPDIKIKLFYGKEYKKLLAKYGIRIG